MGAPQMVANSIARGEYGPVSKYVASQRTSGPSAKQKPAKSGQHTKQKGRKKDDKKKSYSGPVMRAAMRLVSGYGREGSGYGG